MIALLLILLRVLADLVGLALLAFRPRRSLEAENLALRRQLALYYGAGNKAAPHRCCDSREPGDAFEALRLAVVYRCRSPGNRDPLAAGGLASVLAVQVAGRPPAYTRRASKTYSTDGR